MKTRLEPRVGREGAARIHEAFLHDLTATVVGRPGVSAVLYHLPDAPGPFLERLGLPLCPQRGRDLGERLVNAFAAEQATGAERVVALGADSPDLPGAVIDRAFEALRRTPLVLGPAVDGGYYLIGARGVPREALAGVPWGTAEVLAQTLANVRAHALALAVLEPWYDVDRPEDLRFLRTHLELLLETRGEDRAPATRVLLDALLGSES